VEDEEPQQEEEECVVDADECQLNSGGVKEVASSSSVPLLPLPKPPLRFCAPGLMGLSNTSAGVDTVAPVAVDGGNKLGMEPDRWARKRGVIDVGSVLVLPPTMGEKDDNASFEEPLPLDRGDTAGGDGDSIGKGLPNGDNDNDTLSLGESAW